jgi:hypothetical protein
VNHANSREYHEPSWTVMDRTVDPKVIQLSTDGNGQLSDVAG